MSNNLVLERFNYGPDGTFGRLKFPTREVFYTCERPWLNNKQRESCIPEGVYYLEQRYSPVVQRTSNGLFSEGWEITDVPKRTYIMLHPGNWPSDVEGCVAVGLDYRIIQDHGGRWSNAVVSSQDAFEQIMELMEYHNQWVLDVRGYYPEFI